MSSAALPALPSIPNFRDVGGHPTVSGRRVRTGQLYRSVALDAATDSDLAALTTLGVHIVFDLRTMAEQERRPDRLPAGSTHVALDLLTDSGEADPAAVFELMADPPRASIELADGAMERFYVATYHDMIRLPSAQAGYARLYRALATDGGRPALMHCMTGKDRTGWAAAALLLLLGVRPDAIMRDYLISDAEIGRAYQPMFDDFVARGGSREVIEPMMGCKPSFLDAAIEAMLADFGSVERYFGEGLGLEDEVLEALREAFLE